MHNGVLIFLFSVLIASFSQILLKAGAKREHKGFFGDYLNPWVIGGYSILLISSFLTVIAYKTVPLSFGPVLEATGYLWVSLLGVLLLKEHISRRKLLGLLTIIAGILISNLGNLVF